MTNCHTASAFGNSIVFFLGIMSHIKHKYSVICFIYETLYKYFLSMCNGDGCEVKHSCYRFTAKPSEYQSYFAPSPIEDKGCEYYWNTN